MPTTNDEPRNPFARWLLSLTDDVHGRGQRISELTGLTQSYVSRAIRGETKGYPRANTLCEIAAHMGKHPDDLMAEIYGEDRQGPGGQSDEVVVPIDSRTRRDWDRLFAGQPRRAQKVLRNLIRQEQAGYTDLVSEIVDLVLELGPDRAYRPIGKAIDRFEARRARAAATTHRRK